MIKLTIFSVYIYITPTLEYQQKKPKNINLKNSNNQWLDGMVCRDHSILKLDLMKKRKEMLTK